MRVAWWGIVSGTRSFVFSGADPARGATRTRAVGPNPCDLVDVGRVEQGEVVIRRGKVAEATTGGVILRSVPAVVIGSLGSFFVRRGILCRYRELVISPESLARSIPLASRGSSMTNPTKPLPTLSMWPGSPSRSVQA